MNLEDELRSALRREEPPRDWSRDYSARAPRRWRSFAAVAALITVMLPYGIHERRQEQGKEAKRRLVLALELAGSRLHRTRKILRNNSL